MQPREQRLARRLALGYAVTASSIGATLSSLGTSFHSHPSFARLLLWHAPVWIAWGAIAAVLDPLSRRLEWGRTAVVRELFAYAVLAIPVVALHTWFAVWWIWWAHPDRLAGMRALPIEQGYIRQLPIDLLCYCALAAVLLAMRAWQRAAEAERLAREAQVRALEAQLQPHFLFNALQAISTLITKDPQGASEMVNTLSNLLRRSLGRNPSVAITLGDELELADDYLAIQQVRFRDRLRISRNVTADARACVVPPLILQPLLENAFVHGIERIGGVVALTIGALTSAGVLTIEISNDGPPIAGATERIGLRSVRERLHNRFGSAASLELLPRSGGTLVRVMLPATHFEDER